MIRVLVRVVVILVGIAATGVAALLVALQLGWARHHDAPEPPLRAISDSAVIERGRYLVYGPAACAYCHRPKADWPRLARGEMPPLSGNHEFPLPFGAIFSSNLTSDHQTGLGAASDGAIARVLRHGIRRDGRMAVPIMEFQNLTDEDIVAILSFLCTQPAVHQQPQPHRLTFLGRLLLGVVMTPTGPSRPPLEVSPAGATVPRGAYLANDVASCWRRHPRARAAQPHSGSSDGPHGLMVRRHVRRALPQRRVDSRDDHAVGRVLADDRRRSSSCLPLPEEPAAGPSRHWTVAATEVVHLSHPWNLSHPPHLRK